MFIFIRILMLPFNKSINLRLCSLKFNRYDVAVFNIYILYISIHVYGRGQNCSQICQIRVDWTAERWIMKQWAVLI